MSELSSNPVQDSTQKSSFCPTDKHKKIMFVTYKDSKGSQKYSWGIGKNNEIFYKEEDSPKNSMKQNYKRSKKIKNDKKRKLSSSDKDESSMDRNRSYPCTYKNCNKVYKSKENLNLHVKNKHLNQKPFVCSYCNASFSHRNGRIYHIRINHINMLPFKCEEENCEREFASRSALRYHVNIQHYKQKEKEVMEKLAETLCVEGKSGVSSKNFHIN